MLANPACRSCPTTPAAAMARVAELSTIRSSRRRSRNLDAHAGRLDRILGGGEADLATTIENLRQITDNLRDLTEDDQALSGERDLRRAAATAGAQAMNAIVVRRRASAARARPSSRSLPRRCSRRAAAVAPGAGQADVPARARVPAPVARRRRPASLRVGIVNVAAPFRGKSFVFRETELKFEADFYHEFFVAPARDARRGDGARARARRTCSRAWCRPGAPPTTATACSTASSRELYGDVRDAAKPGAVIAITYLPVARRCARRRPFWSQRIPAARAVVAGRDAPMRSRRALRTPALGDDPRGPGARPRRRRSCRSSGMPARRGARRRQNSGGGPVPRSPAGGGARPSSACRPR